MDSSKKNSAVVNKQKITIIIVVAALVLFVVAYYAISTVDWDKLFNKNNSQDGGDDYIYFYDPELSKNIEDDEWYMSLDRTVNYRKGNYTYTLDDNSAVGEGEAVNLLYNLIDYIRSGNHEGYNSCFSSYYRDHIEPKGRFTQQKIYDITITQVYAPGMINSNGEECTDYYFTLDYKIRHNNGSLRDDMGSDCSRTQHIFISNKYSEDLLIDNLYVITYVD